MNNSMSMQTKPSAKSRPQRTPRRNTKKTKSLFQNSPFGPSSTVSRSLYSVVPKTLNAFQQYVTWVTLNPTDSSTTAAYNTYNLSSLYDPDTTGTGHQPLGFDQIMPLYVFFSVVGARITVRTSGNTVADGDTSTSGVIGITLDENSVIGTTNTGTLMEYPNTVWTNVNANTIDKTLSREVDILKFYSNDLGDVIGSGTYSGTVGSSPSRCVYAHVWFGDPTASDTLTPMNLYVTIEFKVVYNVPIDIAAS